MLARRHALADEVVGEAVGPLLELGVGAALVADHEGEAVAEGVGGHLPHVGEVEAGGRAGVHGAMAYLMATGFTGAPVPPVTGSGLATSSIS